MKRGDVVGLLSLRREPPSPPPPKDSADLTAQARDEAPASESAAESAHESGTESALRHSETDPHPEMNAHAGDGGEAAAKLREELRRVKRELQDLLASLASAVKGAP
jgi:hypothetical protein